MPDDVTPAPQVTAPGVVGSSPGEVPAERVALTPAAAELLARLRVQYGELMFHQSGGCCDGSSPMCYPQGELITSEADVHLGDLVVADPFSELAEAELADVALTGPSGPLGVAGDDPPAGAAPGADLDGATFTVPFWMSRGQFEYWSHTHLTVDVVPGRGSGFSVEAPEGVRFIIRSRLFSDEE
ncbi:DUF779 domain-containing protein [Oerskovia sp. Sa1BUA8]|uniref:DUF779 domain-containing protein n=1 Tax=Oerskovia douganii TaxID=2762210 RepID=A0A9D5YZV3_9CELL|nr:DUF779 domain-containing protein [Oerskovia douganii]